MTPEHYERFKALTDKITEVALDEVDPNSWPGGSTVLLRLDSEQKAARYWCKKNASQTLSILTKMHTLVFMTERRRLQTPDAVPPEGAAEDDGIEAEIRKAERKAEALLRGIKAKAERA